MIFQIKKKLIFRYFNIRNFEISKPWSFYIWSFNILYPDYNFLINWSYSNWLNCYN